MRDVFEGNLRLPVTQICQHVPTTPQELDRAKAIQNIHVHNQGLVSQQFKDRVGDQSLQLGDAFPTTIDYLLEMKDKIYLTVLGIDMAARAEYASIV